MFYKKLQSRFQGPGDCDGSGKDDSDDGGNDEGGKNDEGGGANKELIYERGQHDWSLSEGKYDREFQDLLNYLHATDIDIHGDIDGATGSRTITRNTYKGQFDLSSAVF